MPPGCAQEGPARRQLPALSDGRSLKRFVRLEGDRFLLRPMRPEDGSAHARFLARIETFDLQRRLAEAPGRHADVARLAAIDPRRQAVFVAMSLSGPNRGEIVGEVRADHYSPTASAEVGIVVRSDMKRRGLGKALLEAMIAWANEHRIALIARIAPSNAAMMVLAARCGMEIEQRPGTRVAVAHLDCGADVRRLA